MATCNNSVESFSAQSVASFTNFTYQLLIIIPHTVNAIVMRLDQLVSGAVVNHTGNNSVVELSVLFSQC